MPEMLPTGVPASSGRRASRGAQSNGSSAVSPAFLEKKRLDNARRSTPDSEAIGSSEDEHEMAQSTNSLASNPSLHPKPARRESWLSEVQASTLRRQSVTNTNMSSSPQPTTPSSEQGPWPFNNPLGRVSSNPSSTPWAPSAIWGSDLRRESSRHTDLSSSPVSAFSPSQMRSFGDDKSAFMTSTRDTSDQAIPFSIPLQPTPKTYRSQSYSVGQMDIDGVALPGQGATVASSRQRPAVPPGIMHRPARPSMLSEVATDNTTMAALREELDDDNSITGSDAGVLIGPSLRIDPPVESHDRLRQAAFTSLRPRQRSTTASAQTDRFGLPYRSAVQPFSRTLVADSAIEDEGDAGLGGNYNLRYEDEVGYSPTKCDASKRGQWSSSLGFGSLAQAPSSRRHSMAEIPTRRNSFAESATDAQGRYLPASTHGDHFMTALEHRVSHDDRTQSDMHNRTYAATYFSGVGPAIRSQLESTSPSANMSHSLQGFRSGPAQGLFSRPGQDTKLYLVSFKCARTEVHYVAEGTGLEVNEGDLVVVEADRGHDLGTVLQAKLSWARARELKEKAVEEHYRWLMMFSRHNQSAENVNGQPTSGGGMMASSPMNPSAASFETHGHGTAMFDAAAGGDLKPKMIKRHAQSHEIGTLRDKEGNEAKAKRICQQKVIEHKLAMEILDAEFQMDWKKLTFFYYADSYVNFNILVTDLFKIYKTRIWMSAVNPASLTVGMAPSGIGPGAVEGRDSPMDARTAASYTTYGQHSSTTAAGVSYSEQGANSHQGFSSPAQQAGPQSHPSQRSRYSDSYNQYTAPQAATQSQTPVQPLQPTTTPFGGSGPSYSNAYSQYYSAQLQASQHASGHPSRPSPGAWTTDETYYYGPQPFVPVNTSGLSNSYGRSYQPQLQSSSGLGMVGAGTSGGFSRPMTSGQQRRDEHDQYFASQGATLPNTSHQMPHVISRPAGTRMGPAAGEFRPSLNSSPFATDRGHATRSMYRDPGDQIQTSRPGSMTMQSGGAENEKSVSLNEIYDRVDVHRSTGPQLNQSRFNQATQAAPNWYPASSQASVGPIGPPSLAQLARQETEAAADNGISAQSPADPEWFTKFSKMHL